MSGFDENNHLLVADVMEDTKIISNFYSLRSLYTNSKKIFPVVSGSVTDRFCRIDWFNKKT